MHKNCRLWWSSAPDLKRWLITTNTNKSMIAKLRKIRLSPPKGAWLAALIIIAKNNIPHKGGQINIARSSAIEAGTTNWMHVLSWMSAIPPAIAARSVGLKTASIVYWIGPWGQVLATSPRRFFPFLFSWSRSGGFPWKGRSLPMSFRPSSSSSGVIGGPYSVSKIWTSVLSDRWKKHENGTRIGHFFLYAILCLDILLPSSSPVDILGGNKEDIFNTNIFCGFLSLEEIN